MVHHEKVTADSLPIVIVGTGRVARALGRVLCERGAPVVAVAGRNPLHTRLAAEFIGDVNAIELNAVAGVARRVLVAVSDAAIIDVATRLRETGFREGVVLHTAGSLGPEALAPLAEAGAQTGVLYPMQTFLSGDQGVRALAGTYFAQTGDKPAIEWGREIVALVSGHLLACDPAHWGLFHAAAVIASNYQVTLMDAAVEVLGRAGVGDQEALAALAPLVRATLENILQNGARAALSGPIARGDSETVLRNLDVLRLVGKGTRDLYRAAGRRTIPLANGPSLSKSAVAGLESSL